MVCDFKRIAFQITVSKIDLEKELGKHKLLFKLKFQFSCVKYDISPVTQNQITSILKLGLTGFIEY